MVRSRHRASNGDSILYDRLNNRGYGESKLKNNVECEIFPVPWELAWDYSPEEIISALQSNTIEEMKGNIGIPVGVACRICYSFSYKDDLTAQCWLLFRNRVELWSSNFCTEART